jgi:FkbM family methyltransferase
VIPFRNIARHLPNNPVVVEAGAHIGRDTWKMAQRWPSSRIHAFEPVPSVYRQLKESTQKLPNVQTYPFALGTQEERRVMWISGGTQDGSSSLLEPKEHLIDHPQVSFDEKITVDVIALDDWARENLISQIDLLWLDLQGAEMEALVGAREILQTVTAIHAEVNLKDTYSGAVLYPELRTWLEARGFSPVIEAIAWVEGGNVLFVRE